MNMTISAICFYFFTKHYFGCPVKQSSHELYNFTLMRISKIFCSLFFVIKAFDGKIKFYGEK